MTPTTSVFFGSGANFPMTFLALGMKRISSFYDFCTFDFICLMTFHTGFREFLTFRRGLMTVAAGPKGCFLILGVMMTFTTGKTIP
jgi:hypothetical protein